MPSTGPVGGLNSSDAVEASDSGRWSADLFRPRTNTDRKTVTFGDSSAVKSKPFWSLVSFIFLISFWYLATKAWGMPEAFQEPGRTDAQRITLCNQNAACGRDAYSQFWSPLTFPSVRDTWNAFFVLMDEGFKGHTLWQHTWASLYRVIRGMFWGSLIGIPVGFAMGLSSRLRGFFDTPVELFRPIPPLALLPLMILLFGVGDKPAVRLLIFASVWIMIIASRSGVRAANLSKVRAAYSLGASKPQLLFRVLLPNALPELFTGFRVALGVSWGTLVAAELVGASDGLGAMIFAARPTLRLDVMVVGIIVIAVLGVLMDVTMRFLEARLIPWRGKG
jgi:taurine transport system permease protein